MSAKKDLIMLTSLRLFADNGYEAVSVSEIAGELGLVKSALYKHFKNKRDIFDSIIARMEEQDYEYATENDMPTQQGEPEEVSLNSIIAYSKAMFKYWTEDEFASLFRRMLTLEQYRSEEMSALYQQYLVSGPLIYLEDIFAQITGKRKTARILALELYSPMYMLYTLYDGTENKDIVEKMLNEYFENFYRRVTENELSLK